MLETFRNQLLRDLPNVKACNIYLAISGGKDSMTLSHLLLNLNIKHSLLHCNFQLRDEESDLDEEFLLEYAKNNELDIIVKKFNTKVESRNYNNNIQLTARELRYEWFKEFADKDTFILTAHHSDDSIETFFINLLRGTGIKGATGIQKYNGIIYRPLLNFSSLEIKNYVYANNIVYREDSSNNSLLYRRNQIRHEVLPLLESISNNSNKKITSYLSDTAEIQDYLALEAERIFRSKLIVKNNYSQIKLDDLNGINKVIKKTFFSNYGINRNKFSEFIKFIGSKTGSKFITKTHIFYIDREVLLIQNFLSTKTLEARYFVNSVPYIIDDRMSLESISAANVEIASPSKHFLDHDKVKFPITIRSWKKGDKIIPLGMSNSKLVSDVLIDNKLNPIEKNSILVGVNSDQSIIFISQICISEKVKISRETVSILVINYKS